MSDSHELESREQDGGRHDDDAHELDNLLEPPVDTPGQHADAPFLRESTRKSITHTSAMGQKKKSKLKALSLLEQSVPSERRKITKERETVDIPRPRLKLKAAEPESPGERDTRETPRAQLPEKAVPEPQRERVNTPTSGFEVSSRSELTFSSPDTVSEIFQRHRFLISEDIATTIYLSDYFQRPILIEGPAGSGKAELARVWASAARRRLLRVRCRPGKTTEEEYGQWEKLRLDFYRKAIGDSPQSSAKGSVSLLEWLDEHEHAGARSVLLQTLLDAFRLQDKVFLLVEDIDVVDPELEHLFAELLSELQETAKQDRTVRAPRILITAQQRRDLSEQLRALALPLMLDVPEESQTMEMVVLRLPGINPHLAGQVARFVTQIRPLAVQQPPSTEDIIDWVHALTLLKTKQLTRPSTLQTLNVLLHHPADIKEVRLAIDREEITFEPEIDLENAGIEASLNQAWDDAGIGAFAGAAAAGSGEEEPETWWSEVLLDDAEAELRMETYSAEDEPEDAPKQLGRPLRVLRSSTALPPVEALRKIEGKSVKLPPLPKKAKVGPPRSRPAPPPKPPPPTPPPAFAAKPLSSRPATPPQPELRVATLIRKPSDGNRSGPSCAIGASVFMMTA